MKQNTVIVFLVLMQLSFSGCLNVFGSEKVVILPDKRVSIDLKKKGSIAEVELNVKENNVPIQIALQFPRIENLKKHILNKHYSYTLCFLRGDSSSCGLKNENNISNKPKIIDGRIYMRSISMPKGTIIPIELMVYEYNNKQFKLINKQVFFTHGVGAFKLFITNKGEEVSYIERKILSTGFNKGKYLIKAKILKAFPNIKFPVIFFSVYQVYKL